MIQYREMIESLIIDKVASEDNEGISVLKLRNFTKGISNYIGSEINYSQLSQDTSISRPTVSGYIQILKNASLIKTISKYKDNTNQPKHKVYFIDPSILPFFKDDKISQKEWGALIENVVFMHLLRKYCYSYGIEKIQYYRNKEGKEIDFIIPDEKLLIEVKYWQTKKIDTLKLANELNKRINEDEFNNYKKIIITENLEKKENEWEFIPLIKYLQGKI